CCSTPQYGQISQRRSTSLPQLWQASRNCVLQCGQICQSSWIKWLQVGQTGSSCKSCSRYSSSSDFWYASSSVSFGRSIMYSNTPGTQKKTDIRVENTCVTTFLLRDSISRYVQTMSTNQVAIRYAPPSAMSTCNERATIPSISK